MRGAGLRRLRGQRRDAHALSRARLGTRQGARHAASTPATASTWRSTSARMPTGNWSGCHAVGWDRNAPEFGDLAVGDNFQKHSYPLGHHDQRQRRALRRRGRRLPQLHLREVRPRDPDAARAVRLAGVRHQGHPDAARRIPHQARDQGSRRHAGGTGRQARGRQCREGAGDDQGLQRGRHDRRAVRSQRQGRPRHHGPRRSRSRTGPTRSIRRRSRPTP